MNQEEKILYLLHEGPKTTHEFCKHENLASEYRRAISTLRRKGHRITSERIRRGCWLYRLESDPVKLNREPNGQLAFA